MKHRRDANHREIKAAFEQLGCAVVDLSQIGGGVPDLLVSHDGKCTLVEVKERKGKLSQSQRAFAKRWHGPIFVCRTAEGVAALVNLWRGNDDEVEVIEDMKAGKPIQSKVSEGFR